MLGRNYQTTALVLGSCFPLKAQLQVRQLFLIPCSQGKLDPNHVPESAPIDAKVLNTERVSTFKAASLLALKCIVVTTMSKTRGANWDGG